MGGKATKPQNKQTPDLKKKKNDKIYNNPKIVLLFLQQGLLTQLFTGLSLRPHTPGFVPNVLHVCSVVQSCPTLCNPVDSPRSPPGSSEHRILQARTLEWTAMPSSRGIFLTQGLNPGLLLCRRILHRPSCQGSLSSPAPRTEQGAASGLLREPPPPFGPAVFFAARGFSDTRLCFPPLGLLECCTFSLNNCSFLLRESPLFFKGTSLPKRLLFLLTSLLPCFYILK